MRVRTTIAALLLTAAGAAGCGSSHHRSQPTGASVATQTTTTVTLAPAPSGHAPPQAVTLRFSRTLGHLPAARSGIAAASFGSGILVSGGLSDAGTSTDTVFRMGVDGHASTRSSLPGPVHDAASVAAGGRLLLFGGGRFEGSNRIISVAPGRPRQIGTLPQALSDLVAVSIGDLAYVAGGWNGSDTSRQVYAVAPTGQLRVAGSFPVGVRYPAAGALGGRLILAGGELTSGSPTRAAWSFDPATRRPIRLPDLPAATDHTSGAVLARRFYVIGGLRDGAFTGAILSWAPGERHWRPAGHLPSALADTGAVPFDGGIAVLGGRGAGGKVAGVELMLPG